MISDVGRMLQHIDIAVSTYTIDSKLSMLSWKLSECSLGQQCPIPMLQPIVDASQQFRLASLQCHAKFIFSPYNNEACHYLKLKSVNILNRRYSPCFNLYVLKSIQNSDFNVREVFNVLSLVKNVAFIMHLIIKVHPLNKSRNFNK
jgi:hypothetical protein